MSVPTSPWCIWPLRACLRVCAPVGPSCCTPASRVTLLEGSRAVVCQKACDHVHLRRPATCTLSEASGFVLPFRMRRKRVSVHKSQVSQTQDRAYEGYLQMELVQGSGRLRGELTELASGQRLEAQGESCSATALVCTNTDAFCFA